MVEELPGGLSGPGGVGVLHTEVEGSGLIGELGDFELSGGSDLIVPEGPAGPG